MRVTDRRRSWWLTARTVPSAIAMGCYSIVLGISFLSFGTSRRGSDLDPALRWLHIGAMGLFALLVVTSVLTIPMLQRHPDLINQPHGRPLTAGAGRLLCGVALAAIPASIACSVAAHITHSQGYHGLQLVAFIAAGIVHTILSRRPVMNSKTHATKPNPSEATASITPS